jgi:hypothetical protein
MKEIIPIPQMGYEIMVEFPTEPHESHMRIYLKGELIAIRQIVSIKEEEILPWVEDALISLLSEKNKELKQLTKTINHCIEGLSRIIGSRCK